MSTALDSLSHKVQRAAVGTMVDVALAHVNKDRQKAIAEMVDVAKQVVEAYQLCAQPDRPQCGPHHGPQPRL